jgi:hypothetical protein
MNTNFHGSAQSAMKSFKQTVAGRTVGADESASNA